MRMNIVYVRIIIDSNFLAKDALFCVTVKEV